MPNSPVRRSRPLGTLLAAVLAAGGMVALAPPPPAAADTVPASGVPATVSADALPTVQVDGVVWQVDLAGNTVFAGGDFATARPAGASPGSSTVTRSNLLAFDVTTGALDTSFAPNPNGTVRAVAVSPDGRRVYIGGSFTSISGQTRQRIAAYDTATGRLVTAFNARTNGQVRAVVATNTTVYVGGIFSTANGVARNKLAAFDAATGALRSWAPTVEDNRVNALTISPDESVVLVGGGFTSVNGTTTASRGLARLDAVTGDKLALPANAVVYNSGDQGAILGLASEGDQAYAVGYTFGRSGGTLEGVAAIDLDDGSLTWVMDCHGDTYAAHPQGGVVYSASHHHYCGNVRGVPQTPSWMFLRANAMTSDVRQTVQREHMGYTNFEGRPAPSVLAWNPVMDAGTYTGQNQGPWAVTGDDRYVVMGGEFPRVNGTAQQGLVRFPAASISPNDEGPQVSGSNWPEASARGLGPGEVRVTWLANYDLDNERLRYRVIRDGNTGSPVLDRVLPSQIWNRPWMGFTDTGLAPGSTHTYQVRVTDEFGNPAATATLTATAGTSGTRLSDYARTVLDDGASHYWRLGEPAAGAARDTAATNDALTGTAVVRGEPGAIAGDADTAYRSSNGDSRVVAQQAEQNRHDYTVEAWFRAPATSPGGHIVGFGTRRETGITNSSSQRDRILYLDGTGRVQFAVNPGTVRAVRSPDTYRDDRWHHAAATIGPDGIKLYVDGALVASRTDTTVGRNLNGYWRMGDAISGLPNAATVTAFTGWVDEVAIYPSPLTAAQIATHHALGTSGVAPDQPPVASFTASTAGLTTSVDAGASSDAEGPIASYSWNFGVAGATASGVTASHTYAAAGTYTVTLTVTDSAGATATTTRQVTVAAAPANQPPVAAFTATTTGLGVAVDAAGSSDPDGTVASYAWTFGPPGATASGRTASYTYAAAGTYPVTLTVTDDDGATASTTQQVTVTAPDDPPPPGDAIARDDFERAVTDGWGTATPGGSWVVDSPVSRYSVAGGAGLHTLPAGATERSVLMDVVAAETDLRVSVGMDQLPTSNAYLTVMGRRVGDGQFYAARVRYVPGGQIYLHVARGIGEGPVALAGGAVPGLVVTDGERLQVRLQVEGASPTTLRAKVWRVGTPEPTTWHATTTDSTAGLQQPGGLGLMTYLGGSGTRTVSWDDLVVGPIG